MVRAMAAGSEIQGTSPNSRLARAMLGTYRSGALRGSGLPLTMTPTAGLKLAATMYANSEIEMLSSEPTL